VMFLLMVSSFVVFFMTTNDPTTPFVCFGRLQVSCTPCLHSILFFFSYKILVLYSPIRRMRSAPNVIHATILVLASALATQ